MSRLTPDDRATGQMMNGLGMILAPAGERDLHIFLIYIERKISYSILYSLYRDRNIDKRREGIAELASYRR